MSSRGDLLNTTRALDNQGHTLSTKIDSFLTAVKSQPLGFRELGLNFIGIARIVNALRTSLEGHLQSGLPFPEAAVPELLRVLKRSSDDFTDLDKLLVRFMEYERGGALGSLRKGWRMMFADKEVGRLDGQLRESQGALNMAMLLTNIRAEDTPESQYSMLAARLQRMQVAELDGTSSVGAGSEGTDHSDKIAIPSQPEIPIHPGLIPVAGPSIAYRDGPPQGNYYPPASAVSSVSDGHTPATASVVSPITDDSESMQSFATALQEQRREAAPVEDKRAPVPEEPALKPEAAPPYTEMPPPSAVAPEAIPELPATAPSEHVPKQKRVPIIVDRSTLTFREPKSRLPNPAILKNTLISGVENKKHGVIEQLLDRGAPPNTGPEKVVLIIAIRNKDMPTVKLLLEFGADPNEMPTDAHPALYWALQSGEEYVKLLFEYGANPNVELQNHPLINWAMDKKNEALVSLFLQYGAQLSFEKPHQNSPLCYACERIDIPSIIQDLLDWGAPIDEPRANKETPLQLAVHLKREETVKVLIANGADVNKEGTELPLLRALRAPNILQLLLAAGADIKKVPAILQACAEWNIIDPIPTLLEAGADINEPNKFKATPLSTACACDRPEMVDILLAHGADPNLKADDYPIMHSLRRPVILKKLIEKGADPKLCQNVMEVASYVKSLDSVEILIDAGIHPDTKHVHGLTALTTACRDNNLEMAKLLVSKGADVNLKGENYPLMHTLRRPDIMKFLLENGADTSLCPNIIENAAYEKQKEAIEILVAHGMSVDQLHVHGFTALSTACRDNNLEMAQFLVSKGADVNYKCGRPYILEYALKSPEIVKLLLENGADSKLVPGIIELCVWHNSLEVIKILVAHGHSVNEANPNGNTPLNTSIRDRRLEILKYLIEQGATINEPLGKEYIIERCCHLPEFLKVLLDGGADPKLCTGIIELASFHNQVESVRHLLATGKVDINEARGSGHRALTTAIRDQRVEMLRELIKQGADVNLASVDGVPLVRAAGHDSIDQFEILLEAGADVNVQDKLGDTALMMACWKGRTKAAEMLLAKKADVNLINAKGESAMDIAASAGHEELVMMVLEAM